jgi:hypothetical protein
VVCGTVGGAICLGDGVVDDDRFRWNSAIGRGWKVCRNDLGVEDEIRMFFDEWNFTLPK